MINDKPVLVHPIVPAFCRSAAADEERPHKDNCRRGPPRSRASKNTRANTSRHRCLLLLCFVGRPVLQPSRLFGALVQDKNRCVENAVMSTTKQLSNNSSTDESFAIHTRAAGSQASFAFYGPWWRAARQLLIVPTTRQVKYTAIVVSAGHDDTGLSIDDSPVGAYSLQQYSPAHRRALPLSKHREQEAK